LRSSSLAGSYNYGTQRQHSYTVAASNQYKQGLLDKKSVDTLLSYNYNITNNALPSFSNEHVELLNSTQQAPDANIYGAIGGPSTISSVNANFLSENPTAQNSTASTTDFKGHSNALKYTNLTKGNSINSVSTSYDLQSVSTNSLPYSVEDAKATTFKFKDAKSPNLGFLSSEKNVRLIDEMNPAKFNSSFSNGVNNLDDIVSNSIGDTLTPNLATIYSSSKNE
jgi:hypothetical protein